MRLRRLAEKYTRSNVRHIIREDEFKRLIRNTYGRTARLFLALLYCTGARPSEITGDVLKKLTGMVVDDVIIRGDKNEIEFHVPISKVKKGRFSIEKRKLILEHTPEDPAANVIKRYMKKYIDNNTGEYKNPRLPLFNMCRKTAYNIVRRAGEKIGVDICPYNFRHSRLTILAENGAGIEQLLHFKGSKHIDSISPYLHAKEVRFKINDGSGKDV